jgi:hypothetical protein
VGNIGVIRTGDIKFQVIRFVRNNVNHMKK